MSALWAFLGVLAGVAFTGAVSFWSTRRSELAAASIASTLLVDELSLLAKQAADAPDRAERVTDLGTMWLQRRDALVLYLLPSRFGDLNRVLARASHERILRPSEIEEVLAWLRREEARLRESHQAFILTPLWKYLRSRPWRKRGAP